MEFNEDNYVNKTVTMSIQEYRHLKGFREKNKDAKAELDKYKEDNTKFCKIIEKFRTAFLVKEDIEYEIISDEEPYKIIDELQKKLARESQEVALAMKGMADLKNRGLISRILNR